MTANQHQTQYLCELCALVVNTILHCKSHDNQSLINMYPGKDCDLDEYTIMPKHVTSCRVYKIIFQTLGIGESSGFNSGSAKHEGNSEYGRPLYLSMCAESSIDRQIKLLVSGKCHASCYTCHMSSVTQDKIFCWMVGMVNGAQFDVYSIVT